MVLSRCLAIVAHDCSEHVQVTDVHIRYEREPGQRQRQFACGLKLHSITTWSSDNTQSHKPVLSSDRSKTGFEELWKDFKVHELAVYFDQGVHRIAFGALGNNLFLTVHGWSYTGKESLMRLLPMCSQNVVHH